MLIVKYFYPLNWHTTYLEQEKDHELKLNKAYKQEERNFTDN